MNKSSENTLYLFYRNLHVWMILIVLIIVSMLLTSDHAVASSDTPRTPAQPSSPSLVTRYWSAPGTSFTPASDLSTWGSSTGSCRWEPSNSTDHLKLQRGLELPQGAHIKRVEMGGNDTDVSSNMTLQFIIANLTGGIAGEYDVSSDSSSGQWVWGVDTVITVDNYNYVYILNWTNNNAWGSSLQLCSVVVTYEISPLYGSYLPGIVRNNP